MAENKLIIDLIVEDKQGLSKLKTALGSIRQESDKTTDSMNKSWASVAASLAAVYAAYRTVSGVVSGAIKEAKEQEDAINRLNFALKSQGTYTEAYSKAIQGLADQFAQSSKYTDDAVLTVMKTLVQLGNVAPAELQKTTQAVLDFSAATGKGLDDSAMAFVRASQGMARELKVLGFETRKGESEQQAMARAVALIQQQMAGAASNEMKTFSGAVATMNKAWGEMLEQLGKVIIESPEIQEAIQNIIKDLNAMGEWFKANQQGMADFIKGVLDLGDAYWNYADALWSAADAQLAQDKNMQNAGVVGASAFLTQGAGNYLKKVFLGDDPSKTQEEVIQTAVDTQTMLNETVVEAQRAFEEEQVANEDTKAQTQFEKFMENETLKIDGMRQMWAAWQDEKLAGEMIANQHQTEQYQFMLETMQLANKSFWSVAGTLRDQFSNGLSSMLSQAIRGTVSWGDAFKELGFTMVDTLIKYGVQQVVNKGIALAAIQATTSAQVASNTAIAASAAPAAALSSVASFGGAAAAGLAGLAAIWSFAKGIVGLEQGGTTTTSGTVLVGERGPEFLNLPRGASVVPLDRASSGGGETIINIELNNVRMSSQDDIRELAGQISEFINDERRRA
jgi:hypothetical protein